MAQQNESFNTDLYDLLKVRGYRPVPLNSKNQRVGASQQADVIEFTFKKDGEDYGKAWASIDDASRVIIYYDDEQADSPSDVTPGLDYDDSWTGFLKHVKNWAQRRQLDFELSNKDRLGDDMRQRDYYKMKERVSESYHPMGKKASYNDAVPNVKIVLQHNRALEEGEARFRNVAKIYLENVEGERFLAPTTRPGIARVYARHIAEGGVPNDEKWNHIKSICEDYNKMAGFVRATRNGQFNESAQQLVQEGVNHYNNLRETLHKLATHRGYHNYFESYTPALMEDEGDANIAEYFVQEMVDPRIESAMPILSRLQKNVAESLSVIPEVDSLAEWADEVISEKLEMDPPAEKEKAKDKEHQDLIDFYVKRYGAAEGRKKADKAYHALKQKKSQPKNDDDDSDPKDSKLKHFEKKAKRKLTRKSNVDEATPKGWVQASDEGEDEDDLSWIPSEEELEREELRNRKTKSSNEVDENFIGMSPQAVAEEEVEEGLDANQKRVGQLGPTEKVKNNNIGKLVGANESTEIDPELARIMEIAGIKAN